MTRYYSIYRSGDGTLVVRKAWSVRQWKQQNFLAPGYSYVGTLTTGGAYGGHWSGGHVFPAAQAQLLVAAHEAGGF